MWVQWPWYWQPTINNVISKYYSQKGNLGWVYYLTCNNLCFSVRFYSYLIELRFKSVIKYLPKCSYHLLYENSGLRELTYPEVWYWLTLCGQALTGIGAPFVACLPTKISHIWFNENERPLATAILGLSTPVGSILGSGVTPLFVKVWVA